MYRFIESIKLLNGEFYRLKLHQQRMDKVFDIFYPDLLKVYLYNSLISLNFPKDGFYKCRIVFDSKIQNIEFSPYQLPQIRTLKVVEISIPSTIYKSADRKEINEIYAQREKCDDVLLVKNNLVTDSSYCNTAFFDGKTWFTPKKPLIYGIQREELLKNKKIFEKDIEIKSVFSYQSICLFNAMIEFGEIIFSTENIYLNVNSLL
ncbi:MAG: hypothetical protein H6Q19_1016 [Bacteroidetes bacterium]|nr:hypothetical protein [Bacteroidota bacterium]